MKFDYSKSGIKKSEFQECLDRTIASAKTLFEKKGAGNNFLGWLDYSQNISENLIQDIIEHASEIRKNSDIIINIGIGGSYLGTKSLADALIPHFRRDGQKELIYIGQNLDPDYIENLLEYIKGKRVHLIVISKSGTTTEPAIAFRILRKFMKENFPHEYLKRITAITDKEKGALKSFAEANNIKSYVIPDDIGGRYSVFTPVGLVPLQAAGLNIREFIRAMNDALSKFKSDLSENNLAISYANCRTILYENYNKKSEVLINYSNSLVSISEWWKQLFGESEGKEQKALYPSSMTFTTDLHSLGQFVQDGPKVLFETLLEIRNSKSKITVPKEDADIDGLKYLEGRTVEEINLLAAKATAEAHVDGEVPNLKIEIEKIDEYNLAYLYTFFMVSCGISAYNLDVNPFDQPGVEKYKTKMFKLLGKPNY